MTPCSACLEIRDHPRTVQPLHVVHPETGRPQVYDVHGMAICPDCGGVWRRGADNRVVFVGCVELTPPSA